ncbi:MAG: SMP-30/gluconolactonase/LRE family protein [Caulobacteraceae bacterium]
MKIEIVLDAHAVIGESPTWSSAESALYWIDVKEPALQRYDPVAGTNRKWPVTSDIGAFALMDGGAALVALRDGLYRLDLQDGGLELLAPPPFDPQLFRFNEGICDAAGRFWVGVMFDPLEESTSPRKGALHSFTLAGGLRAQPDQAELHNGMAWSADGRRFFLSHSYERAIYAYDYDLADGRLGAGCRFAEMGEGRGIPDGAAVDAEGGYWCALHGGGHIRRYRFDGVLDGEIAMPVSQPTMCAFGDSDLRSLYVTSASDGLSAEQKRREPHAGALFRLRPGVKGIPRAASVK